MKYLFVICGFFIASMAMAQHEHHMETKPAPTAKKPVKKQPAKNKTGKAVVKPKTPEKAAPKATMHHHMADTTRPHTHATTDTVIKHNDHMHMADTAHSQEHHAAGTHRHVLDDSTVITHDANHNEIKDTVSHHHMAADTSMHHDHSMADTIHPQQHNMTDMHAGPDMAAMGDDHSMHKNMSHAYSLHLPMSRNGSGTGWLPDASPMFGYMFHTPKWMYMLHGNLFLRYNSQDIFNKGSRGDEMFDAPNWVMMMGQRKVGNKGLFHFNTMFSLDALITGGKGYPLLFQSGELYNGKALVDRQHPHDLFAELSVSYSHALSQKVDVFGYLGYPGEPAIGPVAFMHRPSALYNPDAPISHHWVDATHITFGVATLGMRFGDFKIEGSSFTGREPGENRYDFDKPRFDSWSGRLSYNPNANWAFQVSQAFVKSPETLHPVEDINRTSVSAIYSLPLHNGSFNATALWGMNKSKDHEGEQAILAEAAWNLGRFTLHGRYEHVEKSSEELALNPALYGDAVFAVNAFTVGFNYDLLNIGKTRLAGGAQFTLYGAGQRLDTLYGKNPMAAEVYLRLYPSEMMRKK